MRTLLRFVVPAILLIALLASTGAFGKDTDQPNFSSKIKRMIVLFDDERAVGEAGEVGRVVHRFKYLPGFVCEVPERSLGRLRTLPGVVKIEEDAVIYVSPPNARPAWGRRTYSTPSPLSAVPEPETIFWQAKAEGVNAQEVWNSYQLHGQGVKVAVLDTGVNHSLPEVGTYLGGYSWVPMTNPDDHDPIDNGVLLYPEAEGDHTYSSYPVGAGHGTCVASIVCGKGTIPDETKSVAGIAYDSGYYGLKVIRSGRPGEPGYPGIGYGFLSWTIGALEWCVDSSHKPDVVNMSFGVVNPGTYLESLRAACNNAYSAGILLVAGSGNGSGYPPVGNPTSIYPAAYENVISVGALTKAQGVATYSNGGVDFIAPGGEGVGDYGTPEWDWVVALGVPAFTWDISGTSGATPHASGMFALMIQCARNIYSGKQKQMVLNNGYFWEAATHSCHDLGLDPVWQGKGKADAKLALDLIANRWPINRSISGVGIAGSTLTYSTTITNILSNSVPVPIGELIADLNVTATQAYYGENGEVPLPGTTTDKPIVTAGSLDLPGTPGATQTIACSDSINTENLPNIARTELKFSFNFVSDGRTMTITDPYALIWDPKFISPTINTITISPAMVGDDETVLVTVDASDNGTVAGVTANSTALAHMGGTTWQGSVPADPALGTHTVSILATDQAGLTAVGTSGAYRTVPVVGMPNKSAAHEIIPDASPNFLFSVWGRVSDSDASGFTLDDGSQYPIRVTAPGHTLVNGDYGLARGTLDNSTTPAVLTSSAARCRKLD